MIFKYRADQSLPVLAGNKGVRPQMLTRPRPNYHKGLVRAPLSSRMASGGATNLSRATARSKPNGDRPRRAERSPAGQTQRRGGQTFIRLLPPSTAPPASCRAGVEYPTQSLPMIPRYSRAEMVKIWEPQTRFRIWFEIEAHACDAMAELGVIPKESAKAIWEKAGNVDFRR